MYNVNGDDNVDINVICNNAVVLNGDIYIDPYNLNDDMSKARYIFITHEHYDHLSPIDIKKIFNDDTKFVATSRCIKELTNIGVSLDNILEVFPNNTYTFDDIKFMTVPSYNIDKSFHPKENNNVGYIIDIDNIKYYIAGDTDLIPEIRILKCDVAFLPVGGTYTMDYNDASKLANMIKPKFVVPTHYGSVVAKTDDFGKKFVDLLNDNIDYKLFL